MKKEKVCLILDSIDAEWWHRIGLQKRLQPIPWRIDGIPYDKWKQLVIIIESQKISSFSFELKVGNLAFNKKRCTSNVQQPCLSVCL
jgi:hypothetical protein